MLGSIASASAIVIVGESSFAIRTILAATATWVLARLACVLLRRSSAAVRHRIWSMSAAACVILPALVLVLPQWPVGGGVWTVSQGTAAGTTPWNKGARTAEYQAS